MRNKDLIARIIVISLLLYSTVHFAAGLKRLAAAEREIRNAEQRIEILTQENTMLKYKLQDFPNRDEMEQLARDKLGMIMPGEKIFVFEETERSSYGTGSW